MIDKLVGTSEEVSVKPGSNVFDIKFNSEANLTCCFASISEIDSNGTPQVASATLSVLNTAMIPGAAPNEWIARVHILSDWRGPLKGRIGLLCT